MTDQFLLTAIRVGLGLMLFMCLVGLITPASPWEATCLIGLAVAIVFGLRTLREF